MRNILFICSQNRLRSPTAEQVFANWPGIETSSAGLNHDAENPVTPELVDWADTIFVMERAHRSKLSGKFRPHLRGKRVICLEIPDEFDFMDPALVRLLKAKVPRHLPSLDRYHSPRPNCSLKPTPSRRCPAPDASSCAARARRPGSNCSTAISDRWRLPGSPLPLQIVQLLLPLALVVCRDCEFAVTPGTQPVVSNT